MGSVVDDILGNLKLKESKGGEAVTAFTPSTDRVLVRLREVGDQTKSGLFVPESATKPTGDTVDGWAVAVGFCKSAFPKADVGDVVVFSRFDGVKIVVDGEELVLLHHNDILGFREWAASAPAEE